MFDTQYRVHERYRTSPGSAVAPVFSSKYDADGRLVVFQSGETNLNSYIQSFKDSVNLDLIVERFQNGDTTAMNKAKGFFYDGEVKLPANLLDCLNMVNQSRAEFESLPAEVRAGFNHDFGKFLSEYGSDNFYSILGVQRPQSDVNGGVTIDSAPNQPAAAVDA